MVPRKVSSFFGRLYREPVRGNTHKHSNWFCQERSQYPNKVLRGFFHGHMANTFQYVKFTASNVPVKQGRIGWRYQAVLVAPHNKGRQG